MKKEKDISSNSVALAGEFAVLSQLALRGLDANMTLGRTKGVDILVSSQETGNMYRLEVKTNHASTRSKFSKSKLFGYTMGWMMNEKHETMRDERLWYCFVNIEKEHNQFRFFIIPSSKVADYVTAEHKFWINRGTDKGRPNLMRTFRFGKKGEKYSISTPLCEDYENRWDFLR